MATIPPAIDHDCPFCGVPAGVPCRTHAGKGRELERPHSRRIALTRRTDVYVAPTWQALCCQCGQLRTFTQARNRRGRWGDLAWERDLCDLKCEPCDRITAHAIVSASARDETGYYLVARGLKTSGGWSEEEVRRIQEQYRQGLPRNPNLNHRYLMPEARAAWNDGSKRVLAVCGESITLGTEPRPDTKERVDGYLIAEQLGDVEYEDPETGMSWIDMDCVDCCRVANARRFAWRRTWLEQALAWVASRPEHIEDHEVECLIDALNRLSAVRRWNEDDD